MSHDTFRSSFGRQRNAFRCHPQANEPSKGTATRPMNIRQMEVWAQNISTAFWARAVANSKRETSAVHRPGRQPRIHGRRATKWSGCGAAIEWEGLTAIVF